MNEPERRLAQVYAERHGLTPPVDVLAALSKHADVVRAHLPGQAEAVVLRKSGCRPLVIVAPGRNSNRERFTLAHELGHIVLPWQVGSAFCHPNATYVAEDDLHQTIEREANLFATELLLPQKWLEQAIASLTVPLAQGIVEVANTAEVSPVVATIALGRSPNLRAAMVVLPPDGRDPYPAATAGCPLPKTQWWDDLDAVRSAGAALSETTFGPYKLVAAVFDGTSKEPQRPPSESTAILKEVLKELAPDERSRISSVINGIVGAANPKTGDSGVYYTILRAKFVARPGLQHIVKHSRFDEYLRAKAHELADRWLR